MTATQQAPPREATVIAWKALERGSMKGFLSLSLPSGMVIHEIMLFEKEGKRWIGLPSRPFEKKDGTKAYNAIVEFPDRDRRDKFIQMALAAMDRYFAEKGRS